MHLHAPRHQLEQNFDKRNVSAHCEVMNKYFSHSESDSLSYCSNKTVFPSLQSLHVQIHRTHAYHFSL